MVDEFEDLDLRSDDIGKIGETKVQEFFQRWRWFPRKEVDDQGIDFSVEIPRAPDGVRRRFLVQVKASHTVAVRVGSGDWAVQIKQAALRKYRNTREPVFLVAYDLSTDCIRCVHTQRWISESGHPLDGDADSEVSLRIDSSAAVSKESQTAFYQAVVRSWSFQDELHHPAPTAIGQIEEELSILDPRFDLKVTASRKGYEYTISASGEPVEAQVSITPSSKLDADGLSNAVKFGSPAKFNVDDFQMEGSPLLERMPRGASVVELDARSQPVIIRFGVIRQKKPRNTLRKIMEIAGELSQGTHGVEVRSNDLRVPFRFAFRTDFVDKTARADIALLPDRLVGLPLQDLGVAKIHTMLRAGGDGELGVQVLLADRPSPGPMALRWSNDEPPNPFLVLASQVARAVGLEAAAKRGKCSRVWGPLQDITENDEETWSGAWRLLNGEAILIVPQSISVNVSVPFEELGDLNSGGFAVQTGARYIVTGWGAEICQLPVRIEYHDYAMIRTGESTLLLEPRDDSRRLMRLGKK